MTFPFENTECPGAKKKYAQVLTFPQAAALLGHTRKQPEPQTLKLTRCHDGVWRALIEAPKFRSGGFTGKADFDAGMEWWVKNHESIINKKDRGYFR